MTMYKMKFPPMIIPQRIITQLYSSPPALKSTKTFFSPSFGFTGRLNVQFWFISPEKQL